MTLEDRIAKLQDTAKWRKAVERLDDYEFDIARMPVLQVYVPVIFLLTKISQEH